MIIISNETIDVSLVIDFDEEDIETKHELHTDLKSWLESELKVSEVVKEIKPGEKGGEIVVEILKVIITSGALTAFIQLITQWVKRKNKNVKLQDKVELPDGTVITKTLEITHGSIETPKIRDFLKKLFSKKQK